MKFTKLNKIICEVDIKNIRMKHMNLFLENLSEEQKRCSEVKTLEIKNIYSRVTKLKEVVAGSYNAAEQLYLKKVMDSKNIYLSGESRREDKKAQNAGIKKDIQILKKEARKQGCKEDKIEIFKKIKKLEKVISLNENSLKILENQMRAELKSNFKIFKELSNDVDSAFSNNEYVDDKATMGTLKHFLGMIAGAVSPAIGGIITVIDSMEAVLEVIEGVNGRRKLHESIDKMDEGIHRIRQKEKQLWVTMLMLKIYLEDFDFLKDFFKDVVNE